MSSFVETTDQEIAREIEEGTYYRNARDWYAAIYTSPIADRSYYIIVIFLALINVSIAVAAFMAVFPIKPHVPFYVYSRDVWEELPRISRITTYRGEDKNVAVMNFFLKNYLINRESYDLQLYELRYRNIWSESGKNVFARYESFMDASNPYGPYQQYSNKQTRSVNVITIEHDDRPQPSGYERARLIFEATLSSVVTGQEISTSRWQADIVYKYSDFDVDQSLDEHVWIAERLGFTSGKLRPRGEKRKVTPMTFRVYDYNVKELLE